MPCRDYRDDVRHDDEQLRRRLTVFAQQMCRAMETLETNNLLHSARITPNMRDWWRDHKEADARRQEEDAEEKRQDRIKARALKKLNPADRKALGLE